MMAKKKVALLVLIYIAYPADDDSRIHVAEMFSLRITLVIFFLRKLFSSYSLLNVFFTLYRTFKKHSGMRSFGLENLVVEFLNYTVMRLTPAPVFESKT